MIILWPIAPADQGLPADASAKDLLNASYQGMAWEGITLGEVKDAKVGNKDAARVSRNDVSRTSPKVL